MRRIITHKIAGFIFRHRRFWRFISRFPAIRDWINGEVINTIVNSTPPRPYPLSLWSPETTPSSYETQPPRAPAQVTDYVSWTSLVDRTYTGRHLPPYEPRNSLPELDKLGDLFKRKKSATGEEVMIPSSHTSVLFCFFAQWFTDSFLRTSSADSRRNTSNHEIDLCQIYGLDAATAATLRSGNRGELAMRQTPRGELLSFLYQPDQSWGPAPLAPAFVNLPYANTLDTTLQSIAPFALLPDRRNLSYATGLERGNSTIVYTSISTIFAREHNRLCRLLAAKYPGWDDGQLFAIARNLNIVMLLRIIIEEYINHLSGAKFKVFVERGFAERQRWYRTNRICLEFDLLYRWHSLVPGAFEFQGQRLNNQGFRFNNALVENCGPEAVLYAASEQRAGRIGLFNTPSFLQPVELLSVKFSRMFKLAPFNAYRTHFGMTPYESFEDLAGDPHTTEMLKQLYTSVDDVELVVGLLAEDRYAGAPLGDMMRTMVGVDAFSQALTNPLLSNNVYGEAAFSQEGLAIVEATGAFEDIVRRNAAAGAPVKARFHI